MKVFITGSTQGIGLAMAEAFVREGHEVTVHCSRDLAKAERIRDKIGAAHAVVADLSNMRETESLYEKTGAVDVLILNASVQFRTHWYEIGDEEFDRQINVNLKSTLKLMQAYYPAMKEKGFGRIITVGSVQQSHPHPDMAIYAATKCAVMSLVHNVAKQTAPFGVTVNNLSPGVIATPRNEAALADVEYSKKVLAGIPVGRAGEASECAGAALLLASPAASYITGVDLVVDGGMSL